MSQNHTIFNITKSEFICATTLGCGSQLISQVGWLGSTSTILVIMLSNSNGLGSGDIKHDKCLEISGRWAGDEIVIQGEYAEPDTQGYISPETLIGFTDISEEVRAAVAELIYQDEEDNRLFYARERAQMKRELLEEIAAKSTAG